MTGTLQVLGRRGHDTLTYDTAKPETVDKVKEKFDEIITQGFRVFDERGFPMTAFDPEVGGELKAVASIAGG